MARKGQAAVAREVKTIEEMKRELLLMLPRLPHMLRVRREGGVSLATAVALCAVLRALHVTHGYVWRGRVQNREKLTFFVDSAELEEGLAKVSPEKLEEIVERGITHFLTLTALKVGWMEKLLTVEAVLQDYRVHVDDEEEAGNQ